ncbi:MAG TPA: phosphotransferase [Acidimicrobiia bacterium]|nr:phosphotransferase [Acidimicrobiia bacterium]
MLADVQAGKPTPRPVAASVEELLDGAASRQPFLHSDSKSGVGFERVVIGGEPHILKHVHIDHDWTMRFFGETTCIPVDVWRHGLMDMLDERIDHATVAVAGGLGRDGLGGALLMREVSPAMVPAGDEPLPLEHHLQLFDDVAALGARMWGWTDDVGLLPPANRWIAFNDAAIAAEEARGFPDPVPPIAKEGWARFAARAPRAVGEAVQAMRRDTRPLVDAAATTPSTFLHGDWKLGNLGIGADGRTVLIDWTYCGAGPICFELGWYLAINRARLPHTKEDAIAAFRAALERHGVDTAGWWERQLGLCLLGAVVLFGWEKAFGSDDEFGWWCDRAVEGARLL